MFVYGKSAMFINLVPNFQNKFIQTLTFYHACKMFINAYLNVRVSTNFNVFYPSPKHTVFSYLPFIALHIQKPVFCIYRENAC